MGWCAVGEVQNVSSIADVKRQARRLTEDEREAKKAHEAKERACFWTWPLGHAYRYEDTLIGPRYVWLKERCAACGKTRIRG